MNILFLRFPLESARGGAELQTVSLMHGLAERGHAVHFAGSCPALLSLCKEQQLPCTEWCIGAPPVTRMGSVTFLWRKRAMRRSLEQLLQSVPQPDVVIMLSMSEKLLLTHHCVQRGIGVLWVEHDRIGRWLRWNPWLPMLRKASFDATTVTVSRLSRSLYLLLGWNPDRTVAIPNGIPSDVPVYRPVHADGAHPYCIACIARLSEEKGIDVLLHALARSASKAQLDVVGVGRQQASLQALATQLGIADRVRWHARVENLEDVYAAADVVVLPSRDHDPFGLAAAEAMMRGIPVIVTDACGVADDLVHTADAYVVPAADADALAQAIDALHSTSRREAVGIAGRMAAMRLFDRQRMVDAYEVLCSESARSR